jgi:hypothetical protein
VPNALLWDPPLIWSWFQVVLLFTDSWVNMLFLNQRNNTPTHYSYTSILISWRLRFRWPLFWPQNQLGEFSYLGKCNHLLEAPCDNPSLNAPNCHSWNTWPSWGPTWHFSPPTICLMNFPCHHEAPTCLAPLLLVLAFAPTTQANILFLGDPTSNFTLVTWRAFIFHAFHHLPQTLACVWDARPLITIFQT